MAADLKALAEAAKAASALDYGAARLELQTACTPEAILSLIRERDEARAERDCSAGLYDKAMDTANRALARAEAAEAALAVAREENERLIASVKMAVKWAEDLRFFADEGTTLAPALAQLRDTLHTITTAVEAESEESRNG